MFYPQCGSAGHQAVLYYLANCMCIALFSQASMWASCCGLLNDLIGSGAVQTHQAGFGGGAGPFRFAPGAGFTPYPSTSSTQSPSGPAPTNGTVCKACGLAFSVLRRKVGLSSLTHNNNTFALM